jgi:flagellar biosynthesis protein FlhB
MGGGEERSEAATPRRRSEARKRGQVAKSSDLNSIIVLLGLLMALSSFGGAAAHTVSTYFHQIFSHLDTARLSPPDVMQLGGQAFMTLARAVGPLMVTAMLLGILANLAQVGPVWATEALKPDFNRLNPLVGAQRFVSPHSLMDLAKSCFKIGLISYIAFITLRGNYPRLAMMNRLDVSAAIALIGEVVFQMAFRIVATMLVLAALDYAFQRYQHEKRLKMTKDEVKQEYKQMEGSPQLKARIRARQKEIAKKRMMADIPAADVIITNPTHFAVALKYDPEQGAAPMVVAKGADWLAQKIRELAQANDVPIVENPPLARALYKQVDVGREIPGELYGAVAEVLAFVYQINQRRRERMERVMNMG